MNSGMSFPDTVEEFMDQYKMTDTDKVYSNGTEYVPIFRMKQWFDHVEEQKYDEWCPGCKEYDQKRHSCPRFNRVIRETLADMRERGTGKWIYCEDMCGVDGYRCDKCGFHIPWDYTHKFIDFIKDYHFCPHCGARLDTPEEK